jgi:hypothetical protein
MIKLEIIGRQRESLPPDPLTHGPKIEGGPPHGSHRTYEAHKNWVSDYLKLNNFSDKKISNIDRQERESPPDPLTHRPKIEGGGSSYRPPPCRLY